jgi:methyltransferase
MELSVVLFLALLALIGLTRLVELGISRRHQRQLAHRNIGRRFDPRYPWMVALHAGVLGAAALEVIWLRRPFVAALAAPAAALFLLATGLRWWAIRSLGAHWNVRVMDSASLGVVATGPFRWVRHPNYLGVFIEMAAAPLIHTAWITALLAAAGNAWVLRNRLRVEEPMLEAHPEYRAAMSGKPRFLPRVF